MRLRSERRRNSPALAGSIRRYAALAAAVSALAVGMAVSAPSASAVMQVGDQGWYAWAADYANSLPYVSGASYAAGTNPWNPQAIIDVGTNNTWRFMVWDCINNNENVAWADRKLPTNTDQSAPWFAGEWVWNGSGWVDTGTPPAKGQGMAYEWMVDLCNRTNTNMWINIPHKASDDYVTKLAQTILFGTNGTTPYTSVQANPTWKPLNSNLKVYVEYSNEVWNAGFDQYHYAGVQATAQGLPDLYHFYGRRVKQVDSLFYTVWSGSTSRLVRVLGTQTINSTWIEDQELAQLQADGGAIDALAIAPYFDVGDGASPNYLANATTAINGQMAIVDIKKTWANAHGVSLVGYEGGQGCTTNADQGRRNANNFGLYQTYLDGCQSHGMTLMNLFAHVGTPGVNNAWGAKEFWAQATSASPSWNGITTWITNHPGSGHGAGGGGIPPAPTGLTATAGNGQVALAWTASSGATAYDVKRSTVSGSGYVTVSSPTVTNYTNTGLTNGTTYYFVVDAKNASGTSANSSQVSATPSASGTSGPAKVNCGGPAVSPFVADADFSGGLTATNWTGAIDTSAVTSPAPQAVYQSERYASTPITYTMPGLTSGTNYTVRLHFCENYWTASGQRKFTVAINGTNVLTNFDIYATAGAAHKANIQQFTAAANGGGQIVIAFTNVTDKALINGIEVNTAGGSGNTHSGTWATKGVFTTTATWQNLAETANVTSNQTYTASFWFKGTGSIVLIAYAGSWGTEIHRATYAATSTWTQYSFTFATGANTQITYVLTDGGGVAGTAYIDDCFMGVLNGTNTLANSGFESGNASWLVGTPFSILQNP